MLPGRNATEAPLTEASDVLEKPQRDLQRPVCPRCGLPVPENRLKPASAIQRQQQGSGAAVGGGHQGSDGRRSKRSGAGSYQQAPTPSESDPCFRLLLACLWCQFSVVLLGLLEACSCCLQGLCSSCCCHACPRCWSAVQDPPGGGLRCPAHCRSVPFEACFKPTECLELCLDCCEICHRG